MENSKTSGGYGWKIIVAMIIILLVVVFSIQNGGDTSISFWFWGGSAPLVLILLICFLIGLLFGLAAILPMQQHSKRKTKLIKSMEQRIEMLEQEINTKARNKSTENTFE